MHIYSGMGVLGHVGKEMTTDKGHIRQRGLALSGLVKFHSRQPQTVDRSMRRFVVRIRGLVPRAVSQGSGGGGGGVTPLGWPLLSGLPPSIGRM